MRSRTLVALGLALSGAAAHADVCVWRDPEKTMTQLFPEARDYKTVDRKIPAATRARIERRLGRQLEAGEAENWTYYTLIGAKGAVLGSVIADAEKGDYGVIEIVLGLEPDGRVRGVYIQRSRERKSKELSAPAFLAQFSGKVGDLTGDASVQPVAGAETASREIAFGVRKMLVFYSELTQGE